MILSLTGDMIKSLAVQGNTLKIITDANPTGFSVTLPTSTVVEKYFNQVTNNTASIPLSTTSLLVPSITMTVPKTARYEAILRLNVSKPSGGGTRLITVEGLINGVLGANTKRQLSVTNDGMVRSLEFSFTGTLNQGDVLTLKVTSSGDNTTLVTGGGYLASQMDLKEV